MLNRIAIATTIATLLGSSVASAGPGKTWPKKTSRSTPPVTTVVPPPPKPAPSKAAPTKAAPTKAAPSKAVVSKAAQPVPPVAPPVVAPEPIVVAPEPVVVAPEPVVVAPEPVVVAAEPVVVAAEPVVAVAEPVVVAAEPVVAPEPSVVAITTTPPIVIVEPPAPVEPIAPTPPVPSTETIAATSIPVAAPTSGYAKGFFIRSTDGQHALAIQGRVQPRYTTERSGAGKPTSTSFEIHEALLAFGGHTFSSAFAYKAEIQFGRGSVALKDFYTDLRIASDAVVRVGQFPRPFSRQQITSSSMLEFDDRAITDKAFGAGRDIGVALHDDYTKSPPFEWAIGVFNGTGEAAQFSGMTNPETNAVSGAFSNVPQRFKPVFVGRVGANFGGIKGYSEGDLEGGGARGAIAASVLAEGDVDDDGKSATRAELDGVFKFRGLALGAAVYHETEQRMEWTDRVQKQWGFHAQASYTIDGTHLFGARLAVVDPNQSDDHTTETTVGYSMFVRGHDLKWQTDVSRIGDDLRARTQIQVGF